ncbi:SpoIIE family protein phosphatase [Streptomyces sp. NPDC001410]|uniref:SpoIIE family protein phosphatase n=1 Tax=Streptomyces sp. NPDC001410 TaxID=3364574 RepID=UPI00367DB227
MRPGDLPKGGGSLDDALGTGLTDVMRRTGAVIGGLYLIEESEPMLRLVALCGLPVEFSQTWQRLPLTAPVPVADAIRDDQLVWIGSQEEMARRYPITAAVLPYRFALAAASLTGVHRCWGGIVLMWPGDHPQEASPRERGHLIASAHRLARLLDDAPRPPGIPEQPRIWPLEAVRHPTQTAMAAADYLDRLPEGALALDLEGRVTFVSSSAARLLGRPADQLLGARPWQALRWLDDPAYEDQYRTAVVSRTPLSFDALRPPDQWLTFRLHPDTSGISVRITPCAQQPTGTAAPAQPADSAAPDARRPAAAPTGRLYQVVHLAAALTETVTVRDVATLIADQILPAFEAQGMVLSAAEAGRLKITAHHGYPDDIVERLDVLPLDTDLTPAGQVLTSGVPAFFASPADMARSHPLAPEISGKQAWAFLPLVITGEPVGCCILSYDRPHTFTADERAVLTPLARLIAQALDRARLYDAQHRLVHELQQTLLPRTLPTLPGLELAARYLPAGHGLDVSGDFYDLLPLDDTTVAAVIGDVEGHSIAAATLMGQVRTAIHAHATAGAAPDEVLSRTNRLLAHLESDLLVTCLYAHVDLAQGRLTLASAGHVPPLLHDAQHGGRILDIEPGPPLGIGTDVHYPVTATPLLDGATLALYTDGLVESPGRDAADTTSGLLQHLAGTADPDLEHLADSLIRHAWPSGQYTDDVTVLLLRAKHNHASGHGS